MAESARSWKTVLYRVLVAIFVIGMITSATAIWANVRLQQSDAWAQTVGPLADDPAVQEYVVDQATLLIERQIAADEDAGRLQAFSRSQLTALVRMGLNDFVTSPTFATWWTQANQAAHAIMMNVMTENEGDFLNTYSGDLVLNLQPAIDWVNSHLQSLFPNRDYVISIPADRTTIVLYFSDTLDQITRVLDLVDTLAVVLPIITLVALVSAFIVATDRLDALKQVGLSVAVSIVILLVILTLARTWFISRQDVAVQDLLDAMLRIVLVDLLAAFRSMAIFGLAVAGIIYALRSKYAQDPRVRAFLREHRELLAGGAIGIAVLTFVLTEYPPLWLSLLTLVVILVGSFLLIRWRGEPEPTSEPPSEAVL